MVSQLKKFNSDLIIQTLFKKASILTNCPTMQLKVIVPGIVSKWR